MTDPLTTPDLMAELQRRKEIQAAFPHCFVPCPCEAGCFHCIGTRKVTKPTARMNADEFSRSPDAVAMP